MEPRFFVGIITNGIPLTERAIERRIGAVDWVGISIDQELKADYAADYDQSGAMRPSGPRSERNRLDCALVRATESTAATAARTRRVPLLRHRGLRSKENGTVPLRFRDSMEQVRMPRAEPADRLRKEIKEYKRTK